LRVLVAHGALSRNLDVLTVSRGYVVFGARADAQSTIRDVWPQFVCVHSSGSSYPRYQQCVSNASRWTELLAERGANELLLDRDFRQVCFGSID
jgi:hypothetical protein